MGVIRRSLALAIILVLPVAGSACATARLNHFKAFADAGAAYSQAVTLVLEEAGASAIAADSMVLARVRPNLSEEQRGQTILENTQLLRERLALLGDLARHAKLLEWYFDALGALAQSDSPSGIGAAAAGVVDSLGKVSGRIAGAKIGETAVSDFVGRAAEIVVARFQLAALERELGENAGTIERELDIQRAALAAVTEQMQTDLQALLLQRETTEVVRPFVADSALPADWARRRREVLQAGMAVTRVTAAADAAEKLRISFISLVEGRLVAADLPALTGDISDVVTLIEEVGGTSAADPPTD